MKTFNHPQLPAGWITSAESLRGFMERGDIKLFWIEDDGAIVSNDLIHDYLACDDVLYVNTLSGGGENGYTAGSFVWLMTNDGSKITMANRRIFCTFTPTMMASAMTATTRDQKVFEWLQSHSSHEPTDVYNRWKSGRFMSDGQQREIERALLHADGVKNVGNRNAQRGDDPATSTVVFRCTPAQKAIIVQAAQARGQNLTTFILGAAMAEAEKQNRHG